MDNGRHSKSNCSIFKKRFSISRSLYPERMVKKDNLKPEILKHIFSFAKTSNLTAFEKLAVLPLAN